MTKEEKYKKILFTIAECSAIGNNRKIIDIISILDTWRYHMVNSVEGLSEKEQNILIENWLNKALERC